MGQGIQKFMHGNRAVFAVAFLEIVALENARDRVFRGQAHHIRRRHFIHPFRIEANFGFFGVENFKHLLLIGLGIGQDLLF